MTTFRPDPKFASILEFYKRYFRSDSSFYEQEDLKLIFGIVPLPLFISICEGCKRLFQREPVLLKLDEPVVVIGDLHGHILDLFRTIGRFDFPPARRYLFLGDVVDRGEFSTETLILVFVLKLLYPSFIHIIRGNHEFLDMAQTDGFCAELNSVYGDQRAERAVMEAFAWLPLAAVMGTRVLCVHGGIGPDIDGIQQIGKIERPINAFDEGEISNLMWSDPVENVQGFQLSPRGLGYQFGPDALEEFLASQHLDCLVRGHQCVDDGVLAQFGAKVWTVFGASNYCGSSGNRAGVLLLRPNGQSEVVQFPSLPYLKRSSVTFVSSDSETGFHWPVK
jgi:protein phosphatase